MTSFYSIHLLRNLEDRKDRYGREVGFFIPPDFEEIKKKILKANPAYKGYYFEEQPEKNCIIKKLKYKFQFAPGNTMCTISLIGVNQQDVERANFASVTIQTVNANCGSIIISCLGASIYKTGLGTYLFKEVLRYIEAAGYSFILLNTAGKDQNKLGKAYFHEKFGFQPLIENMYVNMRSANVNIWYSKYLPNVQQTPPEYFNSMETFNAPEEEDYDEDYDD